VVAVTGYEEATQVYPTSTRSLRAIGHRSVRHAPVPLGDDVSAIIDGHATSPG
jgi:hypothetical protein